MSADKAGPIYQRLFPLICGLFFGHQWSDVIDCSVRLDRAFDQLCEKSLSLLDFDFEDPRYDRPGGGQKKQWRGKTEE